VSEHLGAGHEPRQVSAAVRFALAGACCLAFIVFVVMLRSASAVDSLKALRDVAFTFWGVCINFAICLAAVFYVSYRLQASRKNGKGAA
jgi:putative copper export protein